MENWQCSTEMIEMLTRAITPVVSGKSLRETLSEHFIEEFEELPIVGGWGYTKENAVKFVKSEFIKIHKSDFIPLAYKICEHIIYEELIFSRNENDQYKEIAIYQKKQSILSEKDKKFDVLKFEIECWHDQHLGFLDFEFFINTDHNGKIIDKSIDAEIIKRKNESKITYQRDLWFDITDVFGC